MNRGLTVYCSEECAVMKGFEVKVQVYGVELAKYVLIISFCYVLYLLCEIRTESNPANEVCARSFLRMLSSFELLCLPAIFYYMTQRIIFYLWNLMENTPASLP